MLPLKNREAILKYWLARIHSGSSFCYGPSAFHSQSWLCYLQWQAYHSKKREGVYMCENGTICPFGAVSLFYCTCCIKIGDLPFKTTGGRDLKHKWPKQPNYIITIKYEETQHDQSWPHHRDWPQVGRTLTTTKQRKKSQRTNGTICPWPQEGVPKMGTKPQIGSGGILGL